MFKKNSLLYRLEELLSKKPQPWQDAQIDIPHETYSFAFWYCLKQAEHYEKLQKDLCNISPDDPLFRINRIFEKLEKRGEVMDAIAREGYLDKDSDSERLLNQINKIYNVIEQATVKIIESPTESIYTAKSNLVDSIEDLRQILKDFCEECLGGS